MNRSGAALVGVDGLEECDFGSDLLLVVDDATLDVGRVRFRPEGGSGGHKGLKSVSGTLGTDSYARLRVGVGLMPEGADLSDWVLSPMSEADESTVVGLLPELSEAVGVWVRDGIEEVMNQFNR
jgi:PTH1 family peptidyl-tRNA hydrolase